MIMFSPTLTLRTFREYAGTPHGVPMFLIETWRECRKADPLADQLNLEQKCSELKRRIKKASRLYQLCQLVIFALLVGVIISTASGLAVPKDAPATLMLGSILAVLIFPAMIRNGEVELRDARHFNSARSFLRDLDCLINAIHDHLGKELPMEALAALSKSDLRKMADAVLISQAARILKVQHPSNKVPYSLRDTEGEINTFKRLFDFVFKPFDLADKVYDRYFSEAAKLR